MIVDMPLSELEQYRPALSAQEDFLAFWQQTLAESGAQPLNVTLEERPYPVERVTVYAVRYDGFGESTRIAGWYIVPKEPHRIIHEGKTPTLVFYHGYSASKGLPFGHLGWALQGYNVLAVDTRGQNGETPDNANYTSGAVVGFMTKGILDPATYYYRYAYTDCVRAIDVLRAREDVGPIIVAGGSQGGGLTLAVAALAKEKGIVAALPDVPFLCHFRRSIEAFGEGPYHELVGFWKQKPHTVEASFRTLSYFDGMNFAPHITCPVLMSVGLLDTVCPPSSGFAVYNHLGGEKEIRVYPYNGHDGGGQYQEEERLSFIRRYFPH